MKPLTYEQCEPIIDAYLDAIKREGLDLPSAHLYVKRWVDGYIRNTKTRCEPTTFLPRNS